MCAGMEGLLVTATVTTSELARRVDDPSSAPFILDVRASDQFDRWRIDGKASVQTLNIPYWTALDDIASVESLLPDSEVVVVCAHGGSSQMVAEMMSRGGVVNLEGGMDAWAQTLVSRTLFDDGTHFIVQLDRIAKACLAYVVGARDGSMAVIDPSGSVQPFYDIAESMGSTITDVFDTHLHADHLSLARDIREHTSAAYRIAPGDAEEAAFLFEPLEHGQQFSFGELDLVVRSVATPGHTPGSTSLEVHGRYLMTGDAVFVSGVGRPDLGGQTDPWARDLYRTIHEQLAPLDDSLEVCPAHYTSRTESLDDGTIRRNLGDLLANDPVVSMNDEEQFVQYVVDHLGIAPDVYGEIRRVNLGLVTPDTQRAKELEVGRNECALTG